MTRYLLLFLLAVPAAAQAPSLDQLAHAYATAPWALVAAQTGEQFVCIDVENSKRVDWIVSMIAERAKAQCM